MTVMGRSALKDRGGKGQRLEGRASQSTDDRCHSKNTLKLDLQEFKKHYDRLNILTTKLK